MRRQIVVGLALALGIGALTSTQASAYRAYGTYLPRAYGYSYYRPRVYGYYYRPRWSLSRRAVGLAWPWMALPRV
jgi:hypothetical protein